MAGFIKIDYKMLQWEWYKNEHTKTVFIHCLLKANWKENRWQGITIERGSFVSSYSHMAAETSLSVMQVRTALQHLKSTGEITSKTYSKYTVFTVNNFDLYQSVNTQNNSQITNNQQADNKQITTIEEKKEKKEVKNKDIGVCRFTPPTLTDVKSYCLEKNLNVDANKFIDFYESKGWMVGKNKMKDWKAAVRNWSRSEVPPKPQQKSGFSDFKQNDYNFSELEKELISN